MTYKMKYTNRAEKYVVLLLIGLLNVGLGLTLYESVINRDAILFIAFIGVYLSVNFITLNLSDVKYRGST